MKSNCDTTSCATETSCGPAAECCPGPAQCLADAGAKCPIEGATRTWSEAFGHAMKAAQVELLKARILKAWGPMMEQAADAMIQTMGALWESKIAEIRTHEAREAFKQRLHDLWLSGGKK